MNENIYKNIVFEGGGVKGVAYIGALEVLDKKGILKDINRVAGTSAGAIVALLVGLKYSITEIRTILFNMNFEDFMDDKAGFARDGYHLIKNYGYCEGKTLRNFIEKLVFDKTGNKHITFKQLSFVGSYIGLYFIGTDISNAERQVFSSKTTPDVKIAEAVLISASYPFVFPLSGLNSINPDNIYCDGGLIDNYPIRIFDYDGNINEETIGFRLSTKTKTISKNKPKKIDSMLDVLRQMASLLLDVQTKIYLNDEDWKRTVFIDTLGVKTLDFDLTDDDKNNLIESGRENTLKFLNSPLVIIQSK